MVAAGACRRVDALEPRAGNHGDAGAVPPGTYGVASMTFVAESVTEDLHGTRVDKDPTLPDYGDTGMVLLRTARRGGPGSGGAPTVSSPSTRPAAR
ncbi:hypothetical protein [Streptomyces sp. TRM49041]|uniref:hypothetical protein n=1 Tax=Streptomyces sp. TRM49041 TaxID=2603216 RepID=UPI00292A47C5|nr:hypothetical protein [Streptomyces sp. TRM49041]